MRNFRITFLIVGCLFVFGIYALARIPKQEFPEYTIRQGVVVGVYPGATAEEVEEQLAKPLEQFLMTYKEVKRAKTTSTSQNGMCYVMVELNDDVNDKDEVWSKVKHGLAAFKMQLPAGVAAVVTNDDFGGGSIDVLTLLVKCGLAASKGEARRLVQQGGVSVNDQKVDAIETTFGCEQFTGDGVIIKKGKKVFHRAVLV